MQTRPTDPATSMGVLDKEEFSSVSHVCKINANAILHTSKPSSLSRRDSNSKPPPPYQKRCPQRLITASLAVSRQILHSNVLSWLLLSAEAELLDPGPGAGFSGAAAAAAAAEPEAGGAAAVAIERTGPLKKKVLVGVTERLPNSSRNVHRNKQEPRRECGSREEKTTTHRD